MAEQNIPSIAVTIPEAVRISGLSRSAIYHRISDGTIDARKAGGRTLIMAESLEKYLKSLPPVPSVNRRRAPDAAT